MFDVFQQISCNFVAGAGKKQQAINLMSIVWDGLVAKKFVLKTTNAWRNRKWNMHDITDVSPPPPEPPPPLPEESEKISNDKCLYCQDKGSLLVCEYEGCPLVAHPLYKSLMHPVILIVTRCM